MDLKSKDISQLDILIKKMYNHNHRVVIIIRMFLLMSHLIVRQIHYTFFFYREEFLMTLVILWDLKDKKCGTATTCENSGALEAPLLASLGTRTIY